MNIKIDTEGAFGSAIVVLESGEKFVSEAGAMYRASANMDIDVESRKKKDEGMWGAFKSGIKAMFAGESFFLSSYTPNDGQSGEVGLAPTHQGEVRSVKVGPDVWICSGGSYLGSSGGITLDTQYQGLTKGMFSKEGLVFVQASGEGDLLVNGFGRISSVDVSGGITIDNGHLIAFTEGLEYTISKAGSGWISSMMSGEGLVMNFRGQGKVLVQSHDPSRLGGVLGPLLPPREG
tara:strand:- start:1318 stop:2019 length:702 start_codon:yes stop_codon:yes gene_type:complete